MQVPHCIYTQLPLTSKRIVVHIIQLLYNEFTAVAFFPVKAIFQNLMQFTFVFVTPVHCILQLLQYIC